MIGYIIVQLSDADSIICKRDKHLTSILAQNAEIKVINLDADRIQIIYPNEYEMHEEMGDASVKTEISLHTNFYRNENINLFRLNPLAISGIYCGYRCDYQKVKSLVAMNKQLKHLEDKIYRMVIDDYNYQLNSILVEE